MLEQTRLRRDEHQNINLFANYFLLSEAKYFPIIS